MTSSACARPFLEVVDEVTRWPRTGTVVIDGRDSKIVVDLTTGKASMYAADRADPWESFARMYGMPIEKPKPRLPKVGARWTLRVLHPELGWVPIAVQYVTAVRHVRLKG